MATAEQVQYHYDVDSPFFATFLDSRYMVYSCAVWENAHTLEHAQVNKLVRIAAFAHIQPGQRILDIGCGWGGMMKFSLHDIGVSEAMGLTLSHDQHAYNSAENDPRLKMHLCSWEDFSAQDIFDAVVSIGAFEHFVSREDRRSGRHAHIYRSFFDKCAKLTRADTFVGLQTIVTARTPANRQEMRDARYLLNHVFPGSALPSINDIQAATLGLYEMCEVRTIGADYARTLAVWGERLTAASERIVACYGRDIFEHYQRYFAAAKRNFECGVTDLIQMSLRKLPASLFGRSHGTPNHDEHK